MSIHRPVAALALVEQAHALLAGAHALLEAHADKIQDAESEVQFRGLANGAEKLTQYSLHLYSALKKLE